MMRKIIEFFFDKRIVGMVLLIGLAGVALAERMLATLPMAFFITFAVIAFTVLLTGRIRTSIYFGLALVALIAFVSYAKMKWMFVAPNVVDLYYFAFNPGTLAFLVEGFLPLVIAAALLFFAAISSLFLLGWYEKSQARSRKAALVVFPLSVALAIVSQPKSFSGIDDLMRFRYVTSVFASMNQLAHFGEPVPLLERLAQERKSSKARTQAGNACLNHDNKPDLVVVQAESVVPPKLFYDGDIPGVLKGGFNGTDDQVRPLQVETFSGGTWITTAGFTTALPISDLGWLKGYSNFVLEGRIQQSLAKDLADCGYHTVYLTPLPYSFVNDGRFAESIGFQQVIDQHQIAAPSTHETDAYYYEKALQYMREHKAKDGRPLFMMILTMSAHSPWDFRLAPEKTVAGEPFDVDTATNEYFRRLAISRTDLADFQEKLESLGKPAVLMEFGDHQPGLAMKYWQKREGPTPLADEASGAFLTSFQVLPIGTTLSAPVPSFERLDVQFLGATLLEVAGVPLNSVQADLLSMRENCKGRYRACAADGRLAAHYQCRLDESACTVLPPVRKVAGSGLPLVSPTEIRLTRETFAKLDR